MARKAYEDTQVAVSKSRAQIDKLLAAGDIRGLQWEEDLVTGSSILRFRWRPDPDYVTELVVRMNLTVDMDAESGGRYLTGKQLERVRERARRRLHRVAYWWLKAAFEAVDAGLFSLEDVMLPWVEDAGGRTISEAVKGRIPAIASKNLRALTGPTE